MTNRNRKTLFLCETPYQVLVSLVVKCQKGIEPKHADIAIVDTFADSEAICEQVEASGEFGQVFHEDLRNIIVKQRTFSGYARKLRYLFDLKTFAARHFSGADCYDRILFCVESAFTLNTCAYYRKRNPRLEVFKYEEGFGSYYGYHATWRTTRVCNARNIILGLPRFKNMIRGFYLLEPELNQESGLPPIFKIDKTVVKSDHVIGAVEKIFSPQEYESVYRGKFVIFEESYYTDGQADIDDIELYKDIISMVGAENVVVRLHPRTVKNRFDNLGVQVVESKGVPWEAILIACDLSGCMFAAIASGSVISGRMLLADSTSSILVHRCLKNRPAQLNEDFFRFVEAFNRRFKGAGVFVPENKSELLKYLSRPNAGGHEENE